MGSASNHSGHALLTECLTSDDVWGRKIVNLSQVARWGIPVLPGYVGTVSEFRTMEGLERLQAWVLSGAHDEVIVRSSLSTEDLPGQSMAGVGLTRTLTAVDLAQADALAPWIVQPNLLAILVQPHLRVSWGGVAFVTSTSVVVEASLSSSSAVTSGAIPDIIFEAQEDGRVSCRGEGAVDFLPHLKDLTQVLVETQRRFAFPTDIEWGISGSDVYVFQARHITRPVDIQAGEDG